MTLTSPISHKNPTLGKVQMAQSRMKSTAQCSWALMPQARSVHDAVTSTQSISGEESGMRPWQHQGVGEVTGWVTVSSYSQSSASSCWIPVCVLHLSGFIEGMLCPVLLDLWRRWHPHPWSTCYKWIKEEGTYLFPPPFLCQPLLFRAGSL